MASSIGNQKDKMIKITPGRNVHIPIEAQGNELTLITTGGNETNICLPDFEIIGRHLH